MMLADMLGFLVIFGVMSIAVHEWAHVEMLRGLGRKAKLHWRKGCFEAGTPKDYKGLSNRQLRKVYLSGVFMGLIPIIIGSTLFTPLYWLLLLPYIAWSRQDIKNAWRYR